MKVKLLNNPTLEYSDYGLGLCYSAGPYIDNPEKMHKRLDRVCNKLQHSSLLEFTNFIFQIEASTKVLLEMTRHRIANYACKSSRYTLNKGEIVFESTGDEEVDRILELHRYDIENMVAKGKSNEITSLMLPQAYQYKWQVQFNARSLQNFLELRRSKSAHFHIREVSEEMFKAIPTEMQYLFEKDVL